PPSRRGVSTCSTTPVHKQRIHIRGTKGPIELKIPFNAPNDRPSRILIDSTGDKFGNDISIETFAVCDQYTIEADLFSRAIRENKEVPVPLEDAIKNMTVIEAIYRSAESGRRESPRSNLTQSAGLTTRSRLASLIRLLPNTRKSRTSRMANAREGRGTLTRKKSAPSTSCSQNAALPSGCTVAISTFDISMFLTWRRNNPLAGSAPNMLGSG